jgi:ABC-type branched-subunit amino acid transport system ATPase component
MRGYFAQVRRAGFDIGLSAEKLTKAMVEVLSQLPREATPSKVVVVKHLGLLGQMTKTRDMNAAWNSAKRQSAREHPDRFCLDGKILRWALSGGEQQMTAIGCALMARPRLLMLDEPSLGLAPIVLRALRLCHRGYVLENCAIVAAGSRDTLLADEGVKGAYLGR